MEYLQSMEVPATKTFDSTRLHLNAPRVTVVRPLPQEACPSEQATCDRFTANHGRSLAPHVLSITISLMRQLETLLLHSATRQLSRLGTSARE